MITEKCARADSDHWSVYIDGTLQAAEATDAKAHLTECADCRATVGRLRRIVTMAASTKGVAPPAPVLEFIRREMNSLPTPQGARRRWIGVAAVLIAASMVAVVGLARLEPFRVSAEDSLPVIDAGATESVNRSLSTLDNAVRDAETELSRHPGDIFLTEVVRDARADKLRTLAAAKAVAERSR